VHGGRNLTVSEVMTSLIGETSGNYSSNKAVISMPKTTFRPSQASVSVNAASGFTMKIPKRSPLQSPRQSPRQSPMKPGHHREPKASGSVVSKVSGSVASGPGTTVYSRGFWISSPRTGNMFEADEYVSPPYVPPVPATLAPPEHKGKPIVPIVQPLKQFEISDLGGRGYDPSEYRSAPREQDLRKPAYSEKPKAAPRTGQVAGLCLSLKPMAVSFPGGGAMQVSSPLYGSEGLAGDAAAVPWSETQMVSPQLAARAKVPESTYNRKRQTEARRVVLSASGRRRKTRMSHGKVGAVSGQGVLRSSEADAPLPGSDSPSVTEASPPSEDSSSDRAISPCLSLNVAGNAAMLQQHSPATPALQPKPPSEHADRDKDITVVVGARKLRVRGSIGNKSMDIHGDLWDAGTLEASLTIPASPEKARDPENARMAVTANLMITSTRLLAPPGAEARESSMEKPEGRRRRTPSQLNAPRRVSPLARAYKENPPSPEEALSFQLLGTTATSSALPRRPSSTQNGKGSSFTRVYRRSSMDPSDIGSCRSPSPSLFDHGADWDLDEDENAAYRRLTRTQDNEEEEEARNTQSRQRSRRSRRRRSRSQRRCHSPRKVRSANGGVKRGGGQSCAKPSSRAGTRGRTAPLKERNKPTSSSRRPGARIASSRMSARVHTPRGMSREVARNIDFDNNLEDTMVVTKPETWPSAEPRPSMDAPEQQRDSPFMLMPQAIPGYRERRVFEVASAGAFRAVGHKIDTSPVTGP